ncbi:hypothetical protein LEP1GSC048_0897 [Leptospira santarosai serovar Shermani str. 1342KT]|nr:hypothetical protein LEP1GSC048_0897 [Leptospira santarosai serovar Shermani str. 1342KT]
MGTDSKMIFYKPSQTYFTRVPKLNHIYRATIEARLSFPEQTHERDDGSDFYLKCQFRPFSDIFKIVFRT